MHKNPNLQEDKHSNNPQELVLRVDRIESGELTAEQTLKMDL